MLRLLEEPKPDLLRTAASQVPPAPSLEAMTRDRLRSVIIGLAFTLLAVAVIHVPGLGGKRDAMAAESGPLWVAVSVPLLGAATGLFLIVLRALLPRLPLRWSDPVGALVGTLAVVNCLAWIALDARLGKTAALALAVSCSGFFLFSLSWLIVVTLIGAGGWFLLVWQLEFPPGWHYFGTVLLGATAVGFTIQRLQLHTVRQILTGCQSVADSAPHAPPINEEAEEKFRRWYEATFEGIAIHEKGVIIEANPMLGKLLGCEAAALAGQQLLDWFTLASRRLVEDSILLGNYRPFEAVIRRPDKTEVPLELFSKELFYKGRRVMVTAFRDITERQRAAEALLAEQQRLERQYRRQAAIAEIELNIDDPAALPEVVNRITQAAAQHLPVRLGACTLLCQDRGFRLAASHLDARATEAGFSPLAQLVTLAEWIVENKEPFVASNASHDDPFHVNEPTSLIRAYAGQPMIADGRVIGVLFVLEPEPRQFKVDDLDFLSTLGSRAAAVISKTRLYEELHRANKLLEEQSAVLLAKNLELAEAKEAAESANRARGDLLTIVGHELRTPLNGVLGMTDVLLQTDLNAEQRDCLLTLQTSAENLLTSINRILEYVNLDSETQTAQFSLIDFPEFTARVLEDFRDKTYGKPIEFQCPAPVGVPEKVRGNAEALRQVLSNLLDNAVKFTEAGRISIETSVHSETNGHVMLRLAVSDTGIGIVPEAQQRMFESFAQADGASTRRYGGLGLGLAICKQLVERLGGAIGVDSAPGQGSTFWFTVPFEKA